MKYLIIIFTLILVCNIEKGQDHFIDRIKKENVRITSIKTGQTYLRSSDFNSKDLILKKFGKPDSILTERNEALGGYTTVWEYGKNNFYFLNDESKLIAYFLNDNSFIVVINDSIKIAIGENVKDLRQIIHPSQHSGYTYVGDSHLGLDYISSFSLPYENYINGIHYTNQTLVIIYDPETQKIVRIYDSPLS